MQVWCLVKKDDYETDIIGIFQSYTEANAYMEKLDALEVYGDEYCLVPSKLNDASMITDILEQYEAIEGE